MNTFISKIKIAALLCGISGFSVLALAGEMKDTGTSGAGQNKIEIKDFAFNPQTITVKSGEKITWINRDEEPHTVVSVGKQFQKSPGSTPIKNSRSSPARQAPIILLLSSPEDDWNDRSQEVVLSDWPLIGPLSASAMCYETVFCGFPESFRCEGRAPRGTRSASGHHSFSNRALYRERCLRVTGGLAQATASCNGRLLQPAGCRADHPVCNRHRPGSLALATRRRDNKRQLTAAYDLRADFRFADLLSLLDAVAPPREGHLAACILFRSDGSADDDHADRTSRWNPQRRGNALTSTERSSNEFQSEVRKSELGYCLFERSVKCVSSSVSFSTSAQAATQSPELDSRCSAGPAFVSDELRALSWRRCARRRRARFA